jgi:heat-inducible transcriptional repressor
MEGGAQNKRLTGRQHTLLMAAIQEFITTAEPVGSQQLAARHSLGVRAAMVRNLMAELEDSGYLMQPHTSAGRMPTEQAYRYYVDHLALTPPGFSERSQIELHYSARVGDAGEIIRDTTRLLALMTGQAALITAPRLESVMLERVKFVRLREREVLAVFVASAGGVQSRLVTTEQDFDQTELDRMAGYLNESLSGRTLEQAREWIAAKLREERATYDGFRLAALLLGEAVARTAGPAEVYIDGSIKVMDQPEFANPERLRELLRALDEKTALLDLLERSLRQGPLVSIGSENYDLRLLGFSVVAAPYATGSLTLGSLGVVGPLRMDYERVIPLVAYTARALSRVLEH